MFPLSALTFFVAITTAANTPPPPTSFAEAFELRVRVVPPASAYYSPNSTRVRTQGDATRYAVSLSGDRQRDKFFTWFLNGTQEDVANGKGTIVNDLFEPLGDLYLSTEIQNGGRALRVAERSDGIVQHAMRLSPNTDDYAYLLPETCFIACDPRGVGPNLQERSPRKPSVPWALSNLESNDDSYPENCLPVRIFPECSKFNPKLPTIDRTYAQKVRCYLPDQVPYDFD